MSFQTEPVFVAYPKGWDENLLQHPVMKFLHAHDELFRAKDPEACKEYYASDMTYVKSNGQTLSGQAAVAALFADHALFAEWFYEPTFGTISDLPDGSGYRLLGCAKMYVNLPGPGGEKKYQDLQGRGWECRANGAVIFDMVKDAEGPQGLKIALHQVHADPLPIMTEAIKRGIVPVEALTG